MINRTDDVVTYMNGTSVDSSFIAWVGHDEATDELYVEYLDRPDEIRVYFNVPVDVFFGLVDSYSVGATYNTEIRGRYKSDVLYNFEKEFTTDEPTLKEEDLVTVGSVAGPGWHLSADNFSVVSGDLNASMVSTLSGWKVYDVTFSIGGETGSSRVFADSVGDAEKKVATTLHGLNIGFEITGVVKAS